MKILPICAALLALSVLASAEDQKITITTTDGRKFENVTVSRVEPNGLVLMTDSGIEKVPFTALAFELQKKFGYDPAKASIFQAEQQKADQERVQAINTQRQIQRQKRESTESLAKKIATESKTLNCIVTAVLNEQLLVHCPESDRGHSRMGSVGGGGYVEQNLGPQEVYGTYLLTGYPKKDVALGDSLSVIAIPSGVNKLDGQQYRVYQFVKKGG